MSARMAQVSLKRIIDAVAWSEVGIFGPWNSHKRWVTIRSWCIICIGDVLGYSVLRIWIYIAYLYVVSLFMACSKKLESLLYIFATRLYMPLRPLKSYWRFQAGVRSFGYTRCISGIRLWQWFQRMGTNTFFESSPWHLQKHRETLVWGSDFKT